MNEVCLSSWKERVAGKEKESEGEVEGVLLAPSAEQIYEDQ